MSLTSMLAAIGPDIFSRAVPTTTNPNARPVKKGKTAKSKRRRMREAQQAQASFANQQQLQNDQFKFLKDNIFDRTGATRRTIGGQIEQPGPQGLDYFKNTGPDRPEVAARQARLDATSLSAPGAWEAAQAAVNRQKKVQGWADANTPPPQAPSNFNQDQYMRTPGKFMDVFNNGDGSVTRSRANPYGTARAEYSSPMQGPPAPAKQGPVQQLFQPQAPVNANNVALVGPPNLGNPLMGPTNYGDPSVGPPQPEVRRSAAEWNDLFGQSELNSLPALPQTPEEQAQAEFSLNPTLNVDWSQWNDMNARLRNLFTPNNTKPTYTGGFNPSPMF